MNIRLMRSDDLDDVMLITNMAKKQLAGLGLDQWQTGYPSLSVWLGDVAEETGYVVIDGHEVVGAFACMDAPDPSYEKIRGAWLTGDDASYVGVHRVCVRDGMKGKGIAGQIFAFGVKEAKRLGLPSVRIDTHPGNRPMQRALLKSGFELCGEITLVGGPEDGQLRIAFERLV